MACSSATVRSSPRRRSSTACRGADGVGNLQHQTGRAYARQVRVSGLGFPTAPQINMEPLTGDRRVADTNLIDLRAQKEFTLTSPMKIALFLDALNLTNSDSYEGVGSVLGTSTAFGVRRTTSRRGACSSASSSDGK